MVLGVNDLSVFFPYMMLGILEIMMDYYRSL